MRFQTTLEGAECLRRSDAGWQSVPDSSGLNPTFSETEKIRAMGVNKVRQGSRMKRMWWIVMEC